MIDGNVKLADKKMLKLTAHRKIQTKHLVGLVLTVVNLFHQTTLHGEQKDLGESSVKSVEKNSLVALPSLQFFALVFVA